MGEKRSNFEHTIDVLIKAYLKERGLSYKRKEKTAKEKHRWFEAEKHLKKVLARSR